MVYDKYGPFDGLKLRLIDKPVVKDDEVVLRVHATALHVGDCFSVKGAPFVMRIETGLLKPKSGIPGFDVSGKVEAVGNNVTRFQVGDKVFGECRGGCAEYVCVQQGKLVQKPATLTHEQSAALPTAGLAALHALRDVGKLQPGQKDSD